MRSNALVVFLSTTLMFAQEPAPRSAGAPAPPDPIVKMVARLNLEAYKATIKELTQFGDRRQGTDRNRAAIDWIEVQLKSYGCTNTARLKYEYSSSAPRLPSGPAIARTPEAASGAGRYRGARASTGVNEDPLR